MTGKINGTNLRLFASPDDGVTWNLIAFAKSCSLSISADRLDVTSKDSPGFKEKINGDKEWSLTTDGLVFFGATANKLKARDLAKGLLDDTLYKTRFSTDETGDSEFEGECQVSSYSENANHNEIATFSATLDGNGALVEQAAA